MEKSISPHIRFFRSLCPEGWWIVGTGRGSSQHGLYSTGVLTWTSIPYHKPLLLPHKLPKCRIQGTARGRRCSLSAEPQGLKAGQKPGSTFAVQSREAPTGTTSCPAPVSKPRRLGCGGFFLYTAHSLPAHCPLPARSPFPAHSPLALRTLPTARTPPWLSPPLRQGHLPLL